MNQKDEVSIGAVPEDYPRRLPGFRPRSVGFHARAGGYLLSLLLLVRERSALATLIFTLRVCLSFCHSVCPQLRS